MGTTVSSKSATSRTSLRARHLAHLGCDTGTGDYRGITVTGVTGTGTGSNI